MSFAAVSLPLAETLFQTVAEILAWLGHRVVAAIGYEVTRTGTELRNDVTGFAVDVTKACDGHGILIAWIAVLSVLPSGWRGRLIGLGTGFAAIQLFNLIRIVVLFAASPSGTPMFDALHHFAFPLATSVLILGLAAMLLPALRKQVAQATVALIVLGTVWFFVTDIVSAVLLVPASNSLLALLSPSGIGAIALRPAGWTISSDLIQTVEPLRLYLAQLYPPDFALALPVLLSGLLVKRAAFGLVFLGLIAMPLALALGGMTALWDVAAAHAPLLMAVPAGAGQVTVQDYGLPATAVVGSVKLLQNVIVHFILLVMPVLIVSREGRWS